MAVYDLEEQDQLEDLKVWWSMWGHYVTAAVVAVSVAIVGVQGWRWYQHSQAEQASMLYSAISAAARSNDLPKAKDAMTQLTDRYAGTGYTPRAAMIVARMLFDSGDKAGAKAQLQWVIDRGSEEELKQIARYRLAEVQFDDKQYDDALRTLDAKQDEPFAGLYADLRGDILAAAKRAAEARTAYQTALAKVDPKSPYRNYIEVKLNALGGPLAAGAVAVPAAAGAKPATVAAPAPPPAASGPAMPLTVTGTAPGAAPAAPLTVPPMTLTPAPATTGNPAAPTTAPAPNKSAPIVPAPAPK